MFGYDKYKTKHPIRKTVSKNRSDTTNQTDNFDEQLQEVFDYTKAQFHDTNITPLKSIRSNYSIAVFIEHDFNSEVKEWSKKGDKRDTKSSKEFASYLSQKYLEDKLDNLGSSENVSKIRKNIAKQIEIIEAGYYYHKMYGNNIELTIDSDEEAESDASLEESDASSEESDASLEDDLESEIPTDNINLCFVGGVSTGKSTVLNGVFCEELTQCKIKRTTMVPTVYIENQFNSNTPTEEIFRKISEKNKAIIEKTESGQKLDKDVYEELVFNVGKLDINILEDSYVNVYDIPGLNDARTKDIYYDYLETNFHKFNLVVFLVDIHSGLNTSDEMDMLKFIINNTRDQFEKNKRNIYTLVIVNKADDMQLNEDTSFLEITGELREMYEQVENTITKEFAVKGLKENLIGIIPLCAIDAYLYRMVKKHGRNFKLSPEQILKIGVNFVSISVVIILFSLLLSEKKR